MYLDLNKYSRSFESILPELCDELANKNCLQSFLKLCKQDRQDKMDAVLNGSNENEIIAFHQEFKIKEPTVWNPNYLATLLFLYPQ